MAGLEAAFDRIGASAEHHLEVSHSAGLALAVTDREDVLGVVCRGMADVAAGKPVRAETRFQIGSISKSFAALLVLQEVAAGRLALDVSVNDILPWLKLPEPFGPITLHHLMTHTSGLLVGTEDAPTGPGAIYRLQTNPPTTAPGDVRRPDCSTSFASVEPCFVRATMRSIAGIELSTAWRTTDSSAPSDDADGETRADRRWSICLRAIACCAYMKRA